MLITINCSSVFQLAREAIFLPSLLRVSAVDTINAFDCQTETDIQDPIEAGGFSL